MLKWPKPRFRAEGSSKATVAEERLFHLPHRERVYAIGDVHGRFDLLFGLLGKIKQEEQDRPKAKTTIILLGDLIDRGPESAAVVQFVSAWDRPWARMIALKGNHEERLVRLLEGDSVGIAAWLDMGGAQTLQSYGIANDVIRTAPTGVLIETARSEIPMTHQRWLRARPLHWRCGDYLFVHAGVRPGVALAEQRDHDLNSIRSEFLDSDVDHGCLVVHGHSVKASVERRANRLGIDTGAWQTGRLTAVGLEGSQSWFITEAGAPGQGWPAE